jgi:6-pyruvoyltetrahydropterin/6-carboxytetrahydropterin synthase
LKAIDPAGTVVVDFNPTAENMAEYLLEEVGPKQLAGTPARLIEVQIEETRKCWVTAN